MTPQVLGRSLLICIVTVLLWVAVLRLWGGVDLRPVGIPFRSNDPLRPALLALALGLWDVAVFRRQAGEHFAWLAGTFDRLCAPLAAGASLVTLAIGLRYGSFVAGGADSYGYVSQAYLWLAGDLTIEQPFAREMPWPNADWTFSPLGYRPAIGGGAIVPGYPPGLPMLMALAHLAVGNCGPYFVVPALGALTVWLTYQLGRQLSSPVVGFAGAILLAASPAFLFMLLSAPMSDLAVAAFWLAAVVAMLSRARLQALWTGLLISAAILVRPNLAPLAGMFGAWVLVASGTRMRQRVTQLAYFTAGLLPGVVVMALIDWRLYGAPWNSGYGDVGWMYSWGYFLPNLRRYPRWLLETQTPSIFACALPILMTLRGGDPAKRTSLLSLGALVLGVWASYLFFTPFDAWWYLRFLLPAFPPMLVLAVLGWNLALSWIRWKTRIALLVAIFVVVAGFQMVTVRKLAILHLGPGDAPYVSVAAYVAEALPRNAVLLSLQHSGSLRHYSGRLTLRYDLLAPEWWPQALKVLSEKGYRPFVVLGEWEEPQFRERFALRANGAALPLPGRLVAMLEHPSKVLIYDPLAAPTPGSVPVRIEPVTNRPCAGC